MTPEEINRMQGGGIQVERTPQVDTIDRNVFDATAVDWRSRMNPIKDQGTCNACWAFAATAAIEGRYAMKNGKKVILSEQQMVDCDTSSNGCISGSSYSALRYVKKAGGQVSSASYPYKAVKGSCT